MSEKKNPANTFAVIVDPTNSMCRDPKCLKKLISKLWVVDPSMIKIHFHRGDISHTITTILKEKPVGVAYLEIPEEVASMCCKTLEATLDDPKSLFQFGINLKNYTEKALVPNYPSLQVARESFAA